MMTWITTAWQAWRAWRNRNRLSPEDVNGTDQEAKDYTNEVNKELERRSWTKIGK